MTTHQKQQIDRLEQDMRGHATGLIQLYNTIKAIDPKSAVRALAGIQQYLQEPLDLQIQLDELEEHWNMGWIEKADYIKKKAKLLS